MDHTNLSAPSATAETVASVSAAHEALRLIAVEERIAAQTEAYQRFIQLGTELKVLIERNGGDIKAILANDSENFRELLTRMVQIAADLETGQQTYRNIAEDLEEIQETVKDGFFLTRQDLDRRLDVLHQDLSQFMRRTSTKKDLEPFMQQVADIYAMLIRAANWLKHAGIFIGAILLVSGILESLSQWGVFQPHWFGR